MRRTWRFWRWWQPPAVRHKPAAGAYSRRDLLRTLLAAPLAVHVANKAIRPAVYVGRDFDLRYAMDRRLYEGSERATFVNCRFNCPPGTPAIVLRRDDHRTFISCLFWQGPRPGSTYLVRNAAGEHTWQTADA